MKLTHKLVQPFVHTLEEELPYKVTIADTDGIIIGSSFPERLNSFHPSAYEIACGRAPVESPDADESTVLPENMLLGYGEQIVYDGECIGVIGLIGPPEERRKDMKTAQLILRLLLDREQAQNELDLIAADKNAFIVRLLHSANEQEAWLKRCAAMYGIPLDIPRYVALVRVKNSEKKDQHPLEMAMIRKSILHDVKRIFPASEDIIYESESGEIVIVTTSRGSKQAARREKNMETAMSGLYEQIQKYDGVEIVIGISCECADYLAYPTGYQQALSAIEIGERTEPDCRIFYFEQMRLGRLTSGFPRSIRPILQEGVIDRLLYNQGEHLLETLRIYFNCNMNVAATAGALFIHRNTLQYRFKQIKDLTGYDIRKVDDMIQLRLAVLQYQLFQDKNN